jgi:hypothetical protein
MTIGDGRQRENVFDVVIGALRTLDDKGRRLVPVEGWRLGTVAARVVSDLREAGYDV